MSCYAVSSPASQPYPPPPPVNVVTSRPPPLFPERTAGSGAGRGGDGAGWERWLQREE